MGLEQLCAEITATAAAAGTNSRTMMMWLHFLQRILTTFPATFSSGTL